MNNLILKGQSTPYFIYKKAILLDNIRKFNKFIENGIQPLYAIKSNNYPDLVSTLIENKWGVDIASKEELSYIQKFGVDNSLVSFSAPTKKEEDIVQANKMNVKYYAFDSEYELHKIIDNVDSPILMLRLASYSSNAIFNLSSKFSFQYEEAVKLLRGNIKYKDFIKGITFHVGSQNTSINTWKQTLLKVGKLIRTSNEIGYNITLINLGGGIPTIYSKNDKELDYYIEKIVQYTKRFKNEFPQINTFLIEPGRSVSANTMDLVTKVINIQKYKKPTVLTVDAGVFHGLMEALEHFEYPVEAKLSKCSNTKKYYRIAGFSCDGYDIIIQKVSLPSSISPGDYIIFKNTGAYSFVYEKFHMVDYPPVIELERDE